MWSLIFVFCTSGAHNPPCSPCVCSPAVSSLRSCVNCRLRARYMYQQRSPAKNAVERRIRLYKPTQGDHSQQPLDETKFSSGLSGRYLANPEQSQPRVLRKVGIYRAATIPFSSIVMLHALQLSRQVVSHHDNIIRNSKNYTENCYPQRHPPNDQPGWHSWRHHTKIMLGVTTVSATSSVYRRMAEFTVKTPASMRNTLAAPLLMFNFSGKTSSTP